MLWYIRNNNRKAGFKTPPSPATYRRTRLRLSLAGCAPAEPASVSPAERKLEAQRRESQEELGNSGLTGKDERGKLAPRIEINPHCGGP